MKVSIRFRGRQLSHTENGLAVMNAFLQMLGDKVAVEKPAKMEGRSMVMFISPKPVTTTKRGGHSDAENQNSQRSRKAF